MLGHKASLSFKGIRSFNVFTEHSGIKLKINRKKFKRNSNFWSLLDSRNWAGSERLRTAWGRSYITCYGHMFCPQLELAQLTVA